MFYRAIFSYGFELYQNIQKKRVSTSQSNGYLRTYKLINNSEIVIRSTLSHVNFSNSNRLNNITFLYIS